MHESGDRGNQSQKKRCHEINEVDAVVKRGQVKRRDLLKLMRSMPVVGFSLFLRFSVGHKCFKLSSF